MSSHGNRTIIQDAVSDEFVKLPAPVDKVQVKFGELQPQYQPGDDIRVTYELSRGFTPSPKDWIGLFSSEKTFLFLQFLGKISSMIFSFEAKTRENSNEIPHVSFRVVTISEDVLLTFS